MSPRGTLHLLIGPVGAGKTTYAHRRMARASERGAWGIVDE